MKKNEERIRERKFDDMWQALTDDWPNVYPFDSLMADLHFMARKASEDAQRFVLNRMRVGARSPHVGAQLAHLQRLRNELRVRLENSNREHKASRGQDTQRSVASSGGASPPSPNAPATPQAQVRDLYRCRLSLLPTAEQTHQLRKTAELCRQIWHETLRLRVEEHGSPLAEMNARIARNRKEGADSADWRKAPSHCLYVAAYRAYHYKSAEGDVAPPWELRPEDGTRQLMFAGRTRSYRIRPEGEALLFLPKIGDVRVTNTPDVSVICRTFTQLRHEEIGASSSLFVRFDPGQLSWSAHFEPRWASHNT